MSAPVLSQQVAGAGVKRTRRFRGLRRLVSHVNGSVGLVLVLLTVVAGVAAPLIAPYSPSVFSGDPLEGSSLAHLLGTDGLGRDTLSRLIWGARASLEGGVLATIFAMVAALIVGVTAGYYRGWWDAFVMRLIDLTLAFPFIVLAVGLAAILGPSLLNAAIAIGISQFPQQVRIIRGEVLSIREEDYITAARSDGARGPWILGRHVFPNLLNTVIVQATLILPFAIITEAMLSFLGLGVQPPTAAWGVMLTQAQSYSAQSIALAVYPGIAIMIAALGFNLLGDGLRDALDPRGWR